jgi:hypothetical protein
MEVPYSRKILKSSCRIIASSSSWKSFMTPSIELFEDRCLLTSISSGAQKVIIRKELHNSDKSKVHFCGFIFPEEGPLTIFLPRNSDPTRYTCHDEKLKLAYTLRTSLSKYAVGRKHDGQEGGLEGDLESSGIIGILEWLFFDFLENGLYRQITKIDTRASSKTNWSKTIKLTTPYLTDGQPVYLRPIGSKFSHKSDSDISTIHAQVLMSCYQSYGMMIFGKSIPEIEMLQYETSSVVIGREGKRSLLDTGLRSAYSEHDIKLLKVLLSLVDEEPRNIGSYFIFGVKSFQWMWQEVINTGSSYVQDFSKSLFYPTYKNTEGDYIHAIKRRPETDTIVVNPRTKDITIIDAKYYEATTASNSPAVIDIVKQYNYLRIFDKLFPASRKSNVFIYPGLKRVFQSIHFWNPKTKSHENDLYPPIICLYIDPIEALIAYNTNIKIESIDCALQDL